jgi:hypothetical protein
VDKEYLTIALDDPVLTLSRHFVSKHVLRSLDAIQLACALQAMNLLREPMIFVGSDNRLLTAASAEGLTTENPLLHP